MNDLEKIARNTAESLGIDEQYQIDLLILTVRLAYALGEKAILEERLSHVRPA